MARSIKITTETLDAVNGKAKAHTLNRPSEVDDILADAEAALALAGLAKGKRAGATLLAISGGKFSSAYQQRSRYYNATMVKAERRAGGWAVTGLDRVQHWTSQGGSRRLVLTEVQKAEIAARAVERAVNF